MFFLHYAFNHLLKAQNHTNRHNFKPHLYVSLLRVCAFSIIKALQGCYTVCAISLVLGFPSQSCWMSLVCADQNPNQPSFSFLVSVEGGLRVFQWRHHKACLFVGMNPLLAEDLTHRPGKQRSGTNYTNEFTQIPVRASE